MIAVALLASRPLRDSEGLSGVRDVLMGLTQSTGRELKPLSLPLRGWLVKALHMDLRRTFATAVEAENALEEAMAEAGVHPTPSEESVAGVRPRRVSAPVTVKTPLPKTVQTVAPSKPPRKDAWDAPGEDTRNHSHPTGTLASTPGPLRISFSPRVKGYFKLGALAILMTAGFTAAQFIPAPAKLFSSTGTLVVETKPQGIQLLVDGQPQGVTPLTLTLKAGRHEVELQGSGKPRVFNVYVTKGDRVTQYIEFPATRTRR
jgi:hypothetical protein